MNSANFQGLIKRRHHSKGVTQMGESVHIFSTQLHELSHTEYTCETSTQVRKQLIPTASD